ncbi:MAG: M6 family metalloprotease domain-containing protein [Gemmatimonadetes bacterium]|nr:M6 family metalloprotease domain-containing protein [Gemmatimonadota bacterium]
MYRTSGRVVSLFALAAAGALMVPGSAAAQQKVRAEILRTPSGEVLDFHPDGAWRKQARRVSDYRRALLARGDFAGLNAPVAAGVASPSPAAVSGTKKVPAILFRFFDAGTGSTNPPADYNGLLFGDPAPVGKPYSIKTFYKDLSNNLLTLDGQVIGWIQLDNNEALYTGGANCGDGQNPYGGSQCNGIWSSAARTARISGLNEALAKADTANFAQFDNDGPDGIPASGGSIDDDGFVDLVIFIHSEQDGACFSTTNGHLWSHKSSLPTAYTTNDPRPAGAGGGYIKIQSYTLQSGVGGASACATNQIMAIGTTAHETGHAFGLPDLYDISNATEGIGQWGLMGSGNYATPPSPSRMEAWSLNELGWVTLTQLTTNGTYTLGPAPTSRAAYVVRVASPNTRSEYYFVENRQAVRADSAMIRVHCATSGFTLTTCGGGLAIWHADTTKLQAGKFSNTVNAGSPHGLLLVQADGRSDLQKNANRGDAGDVWPGYCASAQPCGTRYSFDTNPKAVKNASGGTSGTSTAVDSTAFIGFEIDQITQVVPNGDMSFRLRFGQPTIVQATDTLAKVQVDGTAYNRFTALLDDGSAHTIAMDSAQTSLDGKTQWVFQSWSDGGARSHTITGSFSGATYTATVGTKFKLQATVVGGGTVTSVPAVNHTAGVFIDKNSPMTLTATPGAGNVFDRWSGDTTTSNATLLLGMARPYVLVATFVGQLAVSSGAPPGPVMGKGYSFNLTASGGTGSYSWQRVGGAFPQGISLNSQGLISGTPEVSGDFSVTVRVTSGTQTADQPLSFGVTEPTLTVANVLTHLVGQGTPLSADDIKYLDLVGNKNNGYDVGDFLAWVQRTNATPAAPAVLQAKGVQP